jgi:hypothetical protein
MDVWERAEEIRIGLQRRRQREDKMMCDKIMKRGKGKD